MNQNRQIQDQDQDQDYVIDRRETVYAGFFRIDRYRLCHRLHAGGWSDWVEREVFDRGHAVAILPYDPITDQVVLVEQFRAGPMAAGRSPWMVEVVAGMIEPGESPVAVARRECREEAGLEVRALEKIGCYFPSPGAVSETVTLYYADVRAQNLPAHAGLTEEGEDIRVFSLSWADASARLAQGRIDNAATLIALQWLALNRERLRRRQALSKDAPRRAPALVSAAWLAERLHDPDICILDASFFLPAHNRDAQAEYQALCLPGALRFDIDAISDKTSPLPHMMPSAEAFAQAVGALGVGDGKHVVVYDSLGLWSAPRAWWMLRAMGCERVSVLDGGLPTWLNEGRPLDCGAAQQPQPAHFTPRPRPGWIWTAAQLLERLQDVQIVDARAAERFAGRVAEARPGVRSGHIPGACNLPYDQLLDPRHGTMLPADGLAERFAAAGIDITRPAVASCGSGVTACVLALGLHCLGVETLPVYDGSWAEWGSRHDLPLATGDGYPVGGALAVNDRGSG